MPRTVDWEVPGEIQPKPGECSFDLDRVLGVRATVQVPGACGERGARASVQLKVTQ